MLTFATASDRAQADQLMQPCLIRVIDNLRKHTETLDWHSEYIEHLLWPSHTTTVQQQQFADLTAALHQATPEEALHLEQALSQLPAPIPAYELRLTRQAQTASLDVWELCFRVCFQNYTPHQPVSVDTTLLDPSGDIDWITLDEKARALVNQSLSQAIRADREPAGEADELSRKIP
jgi:hypothetical protein